MRRHAPSHPARVADRPGDVGRAVRRRGPRPRRPGGRRARSSGAVPGARIVQAAFRESYFPYNGAEIKEFFDELRREVNPDLVLHPLPRGPASGPPACLRAHLQHVPGPPRPRIRDHQAGRRSRQPQRLRRSRPCHRAVEAPTPVVQLRHPAGQAVVHRRRLPRPDAHPRDGGGRTERFRRSVLRSQDRALRIESIASGCSGRFVVHSGGHSGPGDGPGSRPKPFCRSPHLTKDATTHEGPSRHPRCRSDRPRRRLPAGRARSHDWDIFERTDHVGGLASSVRDPHGFIWDHGGHVMFSHYTYFDELVEKMLRRRLRRAHARGLGVVARPVRAVPVPEQHPPPAARTCSSTASWASSRRRRRATAQGQLRLSTSPRSSVTGIAEHFMRAVQLQGLGPSAGDDGHQLAGRPGAHGRSCAASCRTSSTIATT